MSFPNGIDPVFVPVYPTPLYELAAGLLIGGWLWWRGGKPHPTGAIVGQYFLLSGSARFLVEFVRRNPKVLWGLSNAQLASVGTVIAGVALIVWSATHHSAGLNKAATVGKAA
jgi:phosphatidylglycerol:prolipoprotein diacylglycerol transferase